MRYSILRSGGGDAQLRKTTTRTFYETDYNYYSLAFGAKNQGLDPYQSLEAASRQRKPVGIT